MAVAPGAVQEALALLQGGDLGQAEKRLTAVLSDEPDQFAARHLLGVLYLKRGEHLRALGQFGLAARISPKAAIVFYNRGISLSSLHRLVEAAASYETAIALNPEMAEAHYAFVDSAALLESLDLLIAADTSITHLAGALGRPAWLALSRVPDWRWMLDRPDSPWYPSVRLFRQDRIDDWAPVFEAMAVAVADRIGERGQVAGQGQP